jgi:hypothetical protein
MAAMGSFLEFTMAGRRILHIPTISKKRQVTFWPLRSRTFGTSVPTAGLELPRTGPRNNLLKV